MRDLISRQLAIDMFQNLAYDDWNQGVVTTWANAYSEVAEMIRDLPSAEPKPSELARDIATIIQNEMDMRVILRNAESEVIRCRDCKHNQCKSTSGNALCELFYGITDQMGFCHMAERRGDDEC